MNVLGADAIVVTGRLTIVDGNGVSHSVAAGTYTKVNVDGTTE